MRKMAYDWTGQRTRRIRMVRMATVTLLLILLVGVPALLLR
jgi:hypothetical protein